MRSRRDGALFENLFTAWVLYFFALGPPPFDGITATSDMSDTTATAPPRESPPSLELLDDLIEEIETVFHGKREVVRLAVAALLARGHVLFEDVPGVGKTTLSHALARTLGLGFRRIQFTSDLLPSDVLGVSVYNPQTAEFETRPGPIFTNVVVADEINRAPAESLLSKCGWSPFEHTHFRSSIDTTIINGEIVYTDGALTGAIPGQRLEFAAWD